MTRGIWGWIGSALVGACAAPTLALYLAGSQDAPRPERRLTPSFPAARVTHLLLAGESLYVTTSGNSVLAYQVQGDALAEPAKMVMPSPEPPGASQTWVDENGSKRSFERDINGGSLNEGGNVTATATAKSSQGTITVQAGRNPGRIVFYSDGSPDKGKAMAAPPAGLLTVQAARDGKSALAVSSIGEILLLGEDGSVKKSLNASWVPSDALTERRADQPLPFASCAQTDSGWVCLLNRPGKKGGELLLGVSLGPQLESPKASVLSATQGLFTAGHASTSGAWCAAKVDSGETEVLLSSGFQPGGKVILKDPRYITSVRAMKGGSSALAATWRTTLTGKVAPESQAILAGADGSSKALGSFDSDLAAVDLDEVKGRFALATSKGDLYVISLDGRQRLMERKVPAGIMTRLSIVPGKSGLSLLYTTEISALTSEAPVKSEGSFELGSMRLEGGGANLPVQKSSSGLIKSVTTEPAPNDKSKSVVVVKLADKEFRFPVPYEQRPSPGAGLYWNDDILYDLSYNGVSFFRIKGGAAAESVRLGKVFSPKNSPVAACAFTDSNNQDWAAVAFSDQSVALYSLRQDREVSGASSALQASVIFWLGSAGNWFAVEPKTGKFAGTPDAIKSFGYSVLDDSTGEIRFVSAQQLQEGFLDASYISQISQGKGQAESIQLPAAVAATQAGVVDIIEVTGVKETFQDNMRIFETPAMEAKILLRASDGLKADAIRLSNGISAKSRERGLEIREVGGDNEFELTVKLFPGDNPIRAYASGASAESTGDEVLIRCTAPPTKDSNVWNVLVIAIPQYAPGGGYGDLLAVENDGKSVREAFESVKDKDATFKVTQIDPKKTSKEEVEAQIQAFVQSVRPGENLLIYASAHGDREGDDFYLITKSTQSKDLKGTAISWASISQKISSLNTRNALIVLDACHSGEAIDDQRAILKASKSSADSVAIWASSSPAEKSWVLGEDELKAAKSRAGSPAPGMSVFTLALVEGLRGDLFEQFYRTEWDGVVDLNRLYHLVGLRVADALEKSKGRSRMQQTPMIWGPRADVRLLNRKGAP